MSLQETFNAIREASDKGIWSRAVELSRRDAVSGKSAEGQEVKLSVLNRETGLAASVVLFLDDGDWICDCVSDDDPCLHVVTAVIAFKRAREQGADLPVSKTASGKLVYEFRKVGEFLAFDRFVERDGVKAPFSQNAASIAAGRQHAPDLMVHPIDVEIERVMQITEARVLKHSCIEDLFKVLSKCESLTYEQRTIKISERSQKPVITIFDDGPMIIVRHNPVEQNVVVFANGVTLEGDVLYPSELSAAIKDELAAYKKGRAFSASDFDHLQTEVIPKLRAKYDLDIKSHRLRDLVRVEPYVEIQTAASGDHLAVTGRICYGNPPIAWVEMNRFVLHGDVAPVRMREKEWFLSDRFSREFGFNLGESKNFQGAAALAAVEKIKKFRGEVIGDGYQSFSLAGNATAKVNFENGEINVCFESENKAPIETEAVLSAWTQGHDVVRVGGFGFFKLPSQWLEAHAHYLQRFLAMKTQKDLSSTLKEILMKDFVEAFGIESTSFKNESIPLLTTDSAAVQKRLAAVKATLRGYQCDGVAWMSSLREKDCGGILADDMGLGKTVQAIALLDDRALVVAPTSLMANWCSEIKKFRPDLSVNLYHGGKRQLTNADVTITSFAIARIDCDHLSAQEWKSVFVDEAQYIKNPDSQVSKAVYKIGRGFRMALSGTPIENRLEDLWSEMNFVNPGLLGSKVDFKEHYERPIARGHSSLLARLKSLVAPFVLRRLKNEVAKDLPQRNEIIVRTSLSEEQRIFYNQTYALASAKINNADGEPQSVIQMLEVLLRVRQACCAPNLIPGVGLEESAKLDCIDDMIENSLKEGHKLLLFSQWTKFLDLIEERVKQKSLRYLRLDGSTVNRAEIVEDFQTNEQPTVLLMSLKAGGVGLNLTAADHVIIADPWWNPAAEDQAADRAHRIGQTKPVFIYKIICENTIEENIIALQERKRDLALSVLGQSELSDMGISRDEIKSLFDV